MKSVDYFSNSTSKVKKIKLRIIIAFVAIVSILLFNFFTSVKIKPYANNEIPFTEFGNYNSFAVFGARELKLSSIKKQFLLYLPSVKKMDFLGGNKSYMKFNRKYKWHGFSWDLNFEFESTDALDNATLEIWDSNDTKNISKLYDEIYNKLTEKYGVPTKSIIERSGYDYAYDWKMKNGIYTVFITHSFDSIELEYSQNINI